MNKAKNELPTKEATLFKQILKAYEFKQYKKGLKSAERILKKFPEHGETLAVKGLFLSHLNRKEEGYDFVRKGLKLNLTSYICWHVFGIMNRADKNYEEALKCYRNALRFDKENVQIHRDISLLQIQIRNFPGYNESSMTLLDLRPQTRAYWVGLAVSYHLLGELDLAIKVLNYFEEFSSSGPNPIMEYEHSELLLYKNHLLIKAERYEDVLTNIEKIRGQVFDQRALKEDRALALLRLKRVEEATLAYQELLKTNPDSKFYIERLLECDNLLGELTDEDQTRLLVKFEDLCRDYPRSHLLKYLPLKHLKDESFKGKVKEYLKANLRKGVPSLFSNLKNLYADLSKRAIIEELVLSFLDNLNKTNKFESEDQIEEPITAKLWTLYYLSQHYNKVGNYELAHKYIDEAIDHTPTLVELVKTKAQIYKHQGEIQKAMEIMNEARELDLQDRYINTKCTKYMLRNGKVDEAISTITMFEKPDAVDKVKDLTEIQSIWFIAESAKSFYRSNQLGQALKKVYQVDNYYNIMKDDQFDFHSYCMRKLTMRAYSEMIKFEDHLHEYHYYFNNALLGVDCYLQLHDDPINVKKNNDPLTSGQLSEGAKKKLRKKQRQAQEKDAKKTNDKSGKEKNVDEDPIGSKLLDEEKPLDKAQYFVKLLMHYSSDKVETHLKAFEVYLRKEKLLLALKALIKSNSIQADHPQNKINKGRLTELLTKLKSGLSSELVQVAEEQLAKL